MVYSRLKSNKPVIMRNLLTITVVVFVFIPSWAGHAQKKPYAFEDIFREEKRITLDSRDNFLIGPLPRIGTVTSAGDIIIMDITPRVGVYDETGVGKGRIGGPGDGPGEYRYPLSIASSGPDFYLYDMMLMRISRYDSSYKFVRSVISTTRLDELHISQEGRFFGYGDSGNRGDLVFELNDQGQILRQFAPQSKNFNPAASSRGGGIVLREEYVFFITPYEYTLHKYTLDGQIVETAPRESPQYIAPPKKYDPRILDDPSKLRAYHNQWSHILQILPIGDRSLAVVFAEPGYARTFIEIYDSNLNLIAGNIQLPDYMKSPGALFFRGDLLYMLVEPVDDLENPSVLVYSLRPSFFAL